MKAKPIRVLLIEDDPDDYLLTRDLLAEIPVRPFELEWKKSYEEGLEALCSGEHEVCLLDYRLGKRNGLELLHQAAAKSCAAPIIMLTGQGEQTIDEAAMEAGAADYILKEEMSSGLLERALRHALERERDRTALQQANEHLEDKIRERTEELARLNAVLREADRRKDEFLATLAHELRNPLAPIRTSLHLLRLDQGDEPTRGRVLDMIERQVEHMVRLVDDLMEVSRITRGLIELRREKIDIADIVKTAVETSKPLIEAARHRLIVDLPAEPIMLDGDAVRLAQVLANLLNNAAKYTESGGEIRLCVRPDGGHVEMSIQDTGIGISANMLPRIFDMFAQADRSLKRAQGGLGIGLTLVKRLVELHGGTVEAGSEGAGKGSTFTIRIPTG